jgi:hypothetical protein
VTLDLRAGATTDELKLGAIKPGAQLPLQEQQPAAPRRPAMRNLP